MGRDDSRPLRVHRRKDLAMTTAPTPTPEFLIWAIELRCTLRDIEGFEQPDRTDRQLRAVRAVSDAWWEGRQFEGLCIAESPRELAIPSHAAFAMEQATSPTTAASLPQAFRRTDALQLFRDEWLVESSCRGCPANAEEPENPGSWAGCYGIAPLPADATTFHAAIDSAVEATNARTILSQQHQLTRPAWYGLWLKQRFAAPHAVLLQQIIEQAVARLETEGQACGPSALQALARGLAVTATTDLPMNVALYPRGSVTGRWWNLEPSCPNCKATLKEPATSCPVCGWSGRQGTPAKRRSRGTRPYRPLAEIVGESHAQSLLQRYHEQRNRA